MFLLRFGLLPLPIVEDDGRGDEPSSNYTSFRAQPALAHLHDPIHLQNEVLQGLRALTSHPTIPTSSIVLRQQLLRNLEELRATSLASDGAIDARPCEVLRLRYVQSLGPATVQKRLGISQSTYYREHQRGLEALIAALIARWHVVGLGG